MIDIVRLFEKMDHVTRCPFGPNWCGLNDPCPIHDDIIGMNDLQSKCEAKGFPFTVDSQSETGSANAFDMGEAAGHFSYIEDPDGTLIEFVETAKLYTQGIY